MGNIARNRKKTTPFPKDKRFFLFFQKQFAFSAGWCILNHPYGCRRGGTADALRSGRSPLTRVKVQILSSAPFLMHKNTGSSPFFRILFCHCTAACRELRACHEICRQFRLPCRNASFPGKSEVRFLKKREPEMHLSFGKKIAPPSVPAASIAFWIASV